MMSLSSTAPPTSVMGCTPAPARAMASRTRQRLPAARGHKRLAFLTTGTYATNPDRGSRSSVRDRSTAVSIMRWPIDFDPVPAGGASVDPAITSVFGIVSLSPTRSNGRYFDRVKYRAAALTFLSFAFRPIVSQTRTAMSGVAYYWMISESLVLQLYIFISK